MSARTTHIILNPASAGGKTGRRLKDILSVMGSFFDQACSTFITRKPLDAWASASEAVREGAQLIIAVGGDGTLQEVINGLFLNGHLINPECQLGVLSCGTGKGFAQSVGLPASLGQQVQLICTSHAQLVDVGRVDFVDDKGKETHRYFLNECQLGIGGEVVRTVQQHHKRLGGTLGFGLGTIGATLRYRNQCMKVAFDDGTAIAEEFTGVVVGNGAFTGGGMNLTPGARVDDGKLNILLMHSMTLAQRLLVFPKIYTGTHIHSHHFSYNPASSITVDSTEKVLVEADGELLGTTPCLIRILPAKIPVRM